MTGWDQEDGGKGIAARDQEWTRKREEQVMGRVGTLRGPSARGRKKAGSVAGQEGLLTHTGEETARTPLSTHGVQRSLCAPQNASALTAVLLMYFR